MLRAVRCGCGAQMPVARELYARSMGVTPQILSTSVLSAMAAYLTSNVTGAPAAAAASAACSGIIDEGLGGGEPSHPSALSSVY